MRALLFVSWSLALLIGACGNLAPIHVVGAELPPTTLEGDRLIETRAAVPREQSFFYDITLSGFVSEGEIDLVILREYCRPGLLEEVTEQHVPLVGSVSGEMWTPRLITVRCKGG